MKYGLMFYSKSRNFGDQIQSLAAKQYLPEVIEFLDRDFLSEYDGNEEIKLIMNGWFMADPDNWPPSKKIIPLLISFHVTHDNNANEKMFSDKARNFYKKNGPVGCRDYYTLNLFKSKGIDSYYSGCLTLTLKNSYLGLAKSESIYIVDVLYKIGEKSTDWFGKQEKKWILKQIFPTSIRNKGIFLTQDAPRKSSESEKFELAETTLRKYATAKLVITSRIHCALPCIALGTPVIFIDGGLEKKTDTTRLKGIDEYFNSYSVLDLRDEYKGYFRELLNNSQFSNPLNINWKNLPQNPSRHIEIVEKLKKSCMEFIEK